MVKNKVNLNDLEFCVFDLETTGGNHTKDGIIEIGLVVIKNKKITLEKNYLINPRQKIPDFIQKLTSIYDRDVKDAPVIDDVIHEILEIMSDRILVAHNTSFDVPFFNSVLTRLGMDELKNKSICTNLMTKFLIPNLLSTNLTYMAKMFKLDHGKAHRALDDARASAQLLLRYLDIFEQKNIDKINHLYYPRNKYELDRIHLKSQQCDQSELDAILIKIKTPFLCSLKGERGTLDYVIALSAKKEHLDYLREKIISTKSSWETLSIQIFGSYSEAYLNFLKYIPKLKFETQKEIQNDLLKLFGIAEHKFEAMTKNLRNNPDETITNELGSFVISGHLVKNQYLIFNTQASGSKNMLVFKFPAHQKKLQQFINARIHKKTNFRSLPTSFYSIFILVSQNSDEHIFITKGILKKKQVSQVISCIEELLPKYKYSHNYPQQYI
jgi:DNA polymerase III subunit epsilon